MPFLARALGAAVLGGLATTAYAVSETRQFVLRRTTMPVLPPGHRPLRLLHLSVLHLTPGQRRKQDWVRSLADLEPDLVVDTGDHLSHRESVPYVLDCLDGLLDLPGVFVFGSNDYFEPTLRNPVRYLLPDNGKRHTSSDPLPWRGLRRTFTEAGWVDLTNRRSTLRVRDLDLAFLLAADGRRHDLLLDLSRIADRAGDEASLALRLVGFARRKPAFELMGLIAGQSVLDHD